MNTFLTDEWFECLANDLAHQGWAVRDEFLPQALIAQLALGCRERHAKGLLARAAVGRGSGQAIREGVRGDSIQWLDSGLSEAVDAYLASRTPSQEDRPNGASVASDWAQYRHEVGRVFRATAEAIDMVGAIAGGCDADQRKWIQAAWDTLMEFRNIRSPLGDERRYVERSANRSANSTQRPHKEGEQS